MLKVFRHIMSSLSPTMLLSNPSRERCILNLKQLPAFIDDNHKPTKHASVLVPLCVVDGEVNILYTLRSTKLRNHSGQVSFPGGKMDGNETVVETALRETEEEIGLGREEIDIWTEMAPFQGRDRDMLITPVVGEIKKFDMDKLLPNVYEVDEIFTVPISALCNTNNHGCLMFKPFPLPLFTYGKYTIWGITGLITHMFLECFLPDDVYKPDFLRRKLTLEQITSSKL